MAPLTSIETILAASRRTLKALSNEMDVANQGLEAAQAVRAAFKKNDHGADMPQSMEAIAEQASDARQVLKKAHGELMDMHYAGLRGEELGKHDDCDAESSAKEDHRDQELPMQDHIEHKRAKVEARKWGLPSDDGAKRIDACLASSSTAAATAFAAAEKAAKRRLLDSDFEIGGNSEVDKEVWYPWRTDVDVSSHVQETRPQAATKLINGQENIDFSMFHKELWERAQRRAESMLAEQQAGVYCYRESLPRPQSKLPGCMQVKLRNVQVNTEEKIARCYLAMAAGGGADRNGFLLGASLGRFMTLAKDKSDAPDAKNGGDLGWITRGKIDPRLEEVAFCCPRGACSPPFRVKLASFHILFVEDRR